MKQINVINEMIIYSNFLGHPVVSVLFECTSLALFVTLQVLSQCHFCVFYAFVAFWNCAIV